MAFRTGFFPDPGVLFADSLRTTLASKGITVAGMFARQRIRKPDGALPPNLTILATQRTPLADVLRRIGKNSQNLFAECLLKRIGYEWAKRRGSTDPQGSWALGSAAVTDIFPPSALDLTDFKLADGSGLSRENRCSARQLATLLASMARHPHGRILHDHLSVAGVDGSLRSQLTDMPNRIHAKTGTMRGIRTLAGYVDGSGGSRYAFAVLFNGYTGPSTPYKAIQDRVCRLLARHAH